MDRPTRLAEIMALQGRQQLWLSERTGMTPAHINRLMKGTMRMTPRSARLIGALLGVPADWLIEATEEARMVGD